MSALEPQYIKILESVLEERFIPFLPPLLETRLSGSDQQRKQLSRAFGAFALHKLLDIACDVAAASVIDDYNDQGIDAIYYQQSKETLYLLQSKNKEREHFKQGDAQTFCSGVRLLLQQEFDSFNNNFQNRKPEIESALDECCHIQLIVAYTGNGIADHATRTLESFTKEGHDDERLHGEITYYTADDIVKDLLEEQSYPLVNEEIILHKYSKIEEPRTTYYGVMNLTDLVRLHNKNGKALYERNIRYFLGGKSDVNQAIKNTLRDEPDNFFYLNNGVTAVCTEVKQKGGRSNTTGRKFKVLGLSIINGAQTIASAAEFSTQNPDCNIHEAKLMFTLIKASEHGIFSKRITKARNHQNPVKIANFVSLDDTQERLRREISYFGFNYLYRSEVKDRNANTLLVEEAVRAIASRQPDPRYPVWLHNTPLKLLDSESNEYKTLFSDKLTGICVINSVICYREIEDLFKGYERVADSKEKIIYSRTRYIVHFIMMKSLREIIETPDVLNADTIRSYISLPLDAIRQEILNVASRHIVGYKYPKSVLNQSDVVGLLVILMRTHFKLTEDHALSSLTRIVDSQDDSYPRKRVFDYLSQHAPQLKVTR